MLLEGFGPPDGRWLVTAISRDYFSPDGRGQARATGESAARARQRNRARARRARRARATRPAATAPKAAQKFYARAVEISKKNYDYAWGGGHNSSGTPGTDTRGTGGFGYDCSGYVGACLIAAGIAYDGRASGTFGSLPGAKPGRGKFVSVYYNPGHVYAILEDALGVPHDRADTNPVEGGPSGPHVRKGGAYAGYSVCHFDWGS